MNISNRFSVTGSTLKILAVICMFIDHVAASWIGPFRYNMKAVYPELGSFLYQVYPIMRKIGRLAFPIFCFLLVEGFLHTRNVKKYAIRLFLFALISEIPFDLAFSKSVPSWGHQNVYFTLFIGLVIMIVVNYFEYKPLTWKYDRYLFFAIQIAVCGGGMYLAQYLHTDYRYLGVFLILVLYYLRSDKNIQSIFGAIAISWESTGPLAFLPIWLYNGKRGLKLKYFFYWFYPGHLLILGLIRHLILSKIF